MTAAIARIFPRATAASVANIDALITVALFSGAWPAAVADGLSSGPVQSRRMVLT